MVFSNHIRLNLFFHQGVGSASGSWRWQWWSISLGGTLRGLIECSYICHSLPTLGQSMQVIYGGFGGFNRASTHNLRNLKWNQGVQFWQVRTTSVSDVFGWVHFCPTRQLNINSETWQRYAKHFGSHDMDLHVFFFSRLFREANIMISFSLIFFQLSWLHLT